MHLIVLLVLLPFLFLILLLIMIIHLRPFLLCYLISCLLHCCYFIFLFFNSSASSKRSLYLMPIPTLWLNQPCSYLFFHYLHKSRCLKHLACRPLLAHKPPKCGPQLDAKHMGCNVIRSLAVSFWPLNERGNCGPQVLWVWGPSTHCRSVFTVKNVI